MRKKDVPRYKKRIEKSEKQTKMNLERTDALKKSIDPNTKTALNYVEPFDKTETDEFWRLYVYKNEEKLNVLHLHRKTMFVFGRDKRVADVVLENPSCSAQHAILQYRNKTVSENEEEFAAKPTPYLIDLGSTNGTKLNGQKLEEKRYYELYESDVLEFGLSQRKYVFLQASK
ncbi:Smad nuclear-interacting protein 1 [Bonamia ostreae]|uniref:Smad nuclear-interacting protein 1 n=1 Tax=Bonamia ostreae TaxID=126728 RepID=A0ABV2AH09_9EUKA